MEHTVRKPNSSIPVISKYTYHWKRKQGTKTTRELKHRILSVVVNHLTELNMF